MTTVQPLGFKLGQPHVGWALEARGCGLTADSDAHRAQPNRPPRARPHQFKVRQ